jgi:hypothetical protein
MSHQLGLFKIITLPIIALAGLLMHRGGAPAAGGRGPWIERGPGFGTPIHFITSKR